MMSDYGLYFLLLLAISVGWFIGRRSGYQRMSVNDLPTTAIKSLTDIINQEQDVAIEQFIAEYGVSVSTFETHLALGNASRRRGELEKAITLHRNLISRPSLPRKLQDLACLELGRDYLQSGLLDRAEALFKELIESNSHNRQDAQFLLLSIYEDEHEWEQAVSLAIQIVGKKRLIQFQNRDQKLAARISQFYCELAQTNIDDRLYTQAETYLLKARDWQKQNLRIEYLTASIAAQRGQCEQLRKSIERLMQADAKTLFISLGFIPLALRDQPVSVRETYLIGLYHQTHSIEVLIHYGLLVGEEDSKYKALLENHVTISPSYRALSYWLSSAAGQDVPENKRALIVDVFSDLYKKQHRYRCSNCGFSGKQLHWHCPTCKEWDSAELIVGDTLAG